MFISQAVIQSSFNFLLDSVYQRRLKKFFDLNMDLLEVD